MIKPLPRPRPLVSFERIAAIMPPLDHHPHRGHAKWTPEASEVVRWLAANPQFVAALTVYLRDRRAIVFDAGSGLWRGASWTPPPASPPVGQKPA